MGKTVSSNKTNFVGPYRRWDAFSNKMPFSELSNTQYLMAHFKDLLARTNFRDYREELKNLSNKKTLSPKEKEHLSSLKKIVTSQYLFNPCIELEERSKNIIRARKLSGADISNFILELANYHKNEYKGEANEFRICANSILSILVNEGPALRGEQLVLPLTTMYNLAGEITTREENLVLNSEHTYTQRELLLLGVPMRLAVELNLNIKQN